MDDAITRILFCGSVNGKFNKFFNKVIVHNRKAGPFDLVLCFGEFFGEDNDELVAYINGNKYIPLPTYILGPNKPENVEYYKDLVTQNNEICTNLTYLGKRGLYTLSDGIKIAYLSGLDKLNKKCSIKSDADIDSMIYFNNDDIESVRNSCVLSNATNGDYRGVDILITSQWPQGIQGKIENASELISYLVKEIRPKYHFAALNGSYESQLFRISSDSTTQLKLSSRFIGLSSVDNSSKEKYLYALRLKAVDRYRITDLIQKFENEIECPYNKLDFSKIKRKQDTDTGAQYFFDLESDNTKDSNNRGKRSKNDDSVAQKRQKNLDTETCWFCLSSPSIEKHLVISIGEYFYLALDKGPLNDTHVLILPIKHIQKTTLLSDKEWKELNKFKESLKNFFSSQNKCVSFFERNYKTTHLQINVLGVDVTNQWKVNLVLEDTSNEYGLKMEKVPTLKSPSDLPQKGPYFVAELPDGTVYLTTQMQMFPIHFARDVFCSENLLDCSEKIDWKNCKLQREIAEEYVKEFRKKYQKFDFTLNY